MTPRAVDVVNTEAEALAAQTATLLRIDRLREITAARRQLADAERRTVADLRAQHVPWAQIGEALGVSAQAAQQRFGGAA